MGDVVQLRAGPDTIQIDADSVAMLRGRANKPCGRCAGSAVFLVLCEPCFVGHIEESVGESLRNEGAAVAFGLMGMAEAIREEKWRYTLACAHCDGEVPITRPPYCDEICEERASQRVCIECDGYGIVEGPEFFAYDENGEGIGHYVTKPCPSCVPTDSPGNTTEEP